MGLVYSTEKGRVRRCQHCGQPLADGALPISCGSSTAMAADFLRILRVDLLVAHDVRLPQIVRPDHDAFARLALASPAYSLRVLHSHLRL